MAVITTALAVLGSLLFTPFLMILLCIIFLASIGKSIGVRRLYIKLLLIIFEYGRANIETEQKKIRPNESVDEEEEEALIKSTSNVQELQQDAVENNSAALANGLHPNEKTNGIRSHPSSNNLINRDNNLILVPEPPKNGEIPVGEVANDDAKSNSGDEKYDFQLSNCFDFIRAGMEAIIEDQVTSRFEAEELKNWNLMTRTNRHYEFISWKLTVIWVCGFCIRYFFLFPLRVLICFIGVMWLTLCTALVGYFNDGPFKKWLNGHISMMCFGILSAALSSVITYHNKENIPLNGICVANHTSPIDVLVLMCDNCYSLIGQRHGGFLGVLQRALARASPHIWFERSEVKDRHAVAARLKDHVSKPTNPPILIFPEGTCINNTSVMQFKKGSFEVGSVIYPVAIKYDPRFGDAFWNSNKYSMMQYLYMMMTSWAIVCEVWYLPPMTQKEGETAIDFANRVKSVIATQGGLVDLVWDGQLKRSKPKKEWRERQQEEFSRRLKVE
ncbi:glycerol-3-phosphate acyltransferase 3-like isoform X2 [Atheta coriaria]|uniref:glycerol-3-phosphate acyltransferase 3-like isoform X2 n=1 Tax=Dalotia coriaria TaxID=877792 RepID=UPI0031F3C495